MSKNSSIAVTHELKEQLKKEKIEVQAKLGKELTMGEFLIVLLERKVPA